MGYHFPHESDIYTNSLYMKGKSAIRLLFLSLLFVIFSSYLLAESVVSSKEKTQKKRQDFIKQQQTTGLGEKSPEQAIKDILVFVRNYHDYAGSEAVLENINDLNRLEKFLHDYKLLNTKALSNQNLLQKVRVQIYEDLIGYLRSYNKVSEAVALQRKLIATATGDRRIQLDLAKLLSESPDGYQEAMTIYLRLCKEDPEDLYAVTGLARLQALKRDFTEALKNYELLVKVRPQDFSLKLEYARLLAQLDRHEEARAHLKQIINASPEFRSAKLELARIEVRLGNLSKADEQLKVLASDPKLSLELKKEVYTTYREMIAKQDDLSMRRWYAGAFSQEKRTLDLSIAEYREILKSGRADQDDRLALARVLSWNDNFDESLSLYRELLKSDPNSQALLAELAKVLRWAKRYPEAIAVTNRLLDLQPQSPEYKLEKARILTDTKDYELSLKLYQEVIQANPNQPRIRLEYAQALNWSGRSEQACREYEQMLPLAPSTEAYLEYARALTAQRRYAESERIYRKIIQERPEDRAIKLEYAQSLAWRNDLKAAQQQFSDVMKDLIDPRKTFAKILFWHGKYEEARAECLSLLNLKPNDIELRFDAARALVRLEEFEEAINELEQLRAEFPDNKEIADEYNRAVDLKKARALNVDRTERSSKEGKAEKDKPKSKSISKKLGQDPRAIIIEPIRTDTKLSKEELHDIEKNKEILKEEPDNDSLRLELANQILWSKDYREAMKMYRSILAEDPDDINAQLGLAEAFLYTDDYNSAYIIFNKVLGEDPTNVRARFGLAQIYAYGSKIPDSHSALKELKQILTVSFTNVPAWETQNELARDLNPSMDPVSYGLFDSDRFTRFTAGSDYRHPLNSKTTLISGYRYHIVYQRFQPLWDWISYKDWFGKHLTGRSYGFGVKHRLAHNAQLQAYVGGTNFNGGLSFLDASASLDFLLRRNHLFRVSYERQPGIFFINTVLVLAGGLYGDRFQLAHNYEFHRKWEFSQSYRFTHLTGDRFGVPHNVMKEAQASIHYKLSNNSGLGVSYSFLGFRQPSHMYFSPREHRALGGEFFYQKAYKRIGMALFGSAGKLFTDQVNGFYATAKSELTLRLSDALKLDLSYQPLYSSAGSLVGSKSYRYHMFMINLRYLWDRNR